MSTQSKQVIRDSRNTQHTPTPWETNNRYNQYKTDQGDWRFSVRIGQQANALGDTLVEAASNAAFIVSAVNSHNAFLSIVKRLRETCDDPGCADCIEADEAISKAEGNA